MKIYGDGEVKNGFRTGAKMLQLNYVLDPENRNDIDALAFIEAHKENYTGIAFAREKDDSMRLIAAIPLVEVM